MKKKIATGLLATLLLACLSGVAGAAFTDISDPDMATAAATLQGMGVVTGTGNSSFNPNGELTRAEVCAMAVRAMGLADQVQTYARKTLFSDVAASAWYNGYVNLAYAKGIINGYGNGTFGPEDPITYGQLDTILLRMLGYSSQEIGSVWPLDHTAFADDLGLSEGLNLSPYGKVKRGEAAMLFYRTMKETVNGSGKSYYQTISGLSSTEEGILLDTAASYGEKTGLLLFYSTASGDTVYYEQACSQSDALEGNVGTLLFNGAGRVIGFVPGGSGFDDVTIGSATASTLTDQSGKSWRIPSDAVVIADGEVMPYRTGGYLQLQGKAGKTARVFYDESGVISHIYLAGGTTSSAQAAVAETASAQSSLARTLGISGKSYTITKNGAAAEGEDLARYDVGYYDVASATLRVCDWKVTGYLSAASPSLAAADSVTVAGCTFEVLECAWESLGNFRLGEKVTLLLTDDCKVAAACSTSEISADMVGVLAENGKSVTLAGSGVTLTAGEISYKDSAAGGLVTVSSTSASKLTCTAVSTGTGKKLDLTGRTMGDLTLAPTCAVYEWTGSGYVYDLEGERGKASYSFDAIDWIDTLSASCVSYYHTNSAGQVDMLLLKNVTGNCYQYGVLSVYTGTNGVNFGSGSMTAYNDVATLTNSAGTTEKYLYTLSAAGSGYVGITIGPGSNQYSRIVSALSLERLGTVETTGFFRQNGDWYVAIAGEEYRVAENVEIQIKNTNLWLNGEEGLLNVLSGGYTLNLYTDGSAGNRIRLISASPTS